MPEMTVTVRWPDGELEQCYSPSLVMHDHLSAGETYSVQDFVRRAGTALDEAGRRVQEKFGFACTSALSQKQRIEDRARQFEPFPDGLVHVLAMEPQLPADLPRAGSHGA